MQGDATGGEGANGRHAGALLRRASLGIEQWRDPDALIAVLGAATKLQTRAISRLQQLRVLPPEPESPDRYLGIRELSRKINRSISWIRHQPRDAIPGRRQHCEGGRVEWSERAVQTWLEASTLQGL